MGGHIPDEDGYAYARDQRTKAKLGDRANWAQSKMNESVPIAGSFHCHVQILTCSNAIVRSRTGRVFSTRYFHDCLSFHNCTLNFAKEIAPRQRTTQKICMEMLVKNATTESKLSKANSELHTLLYLISFRLIIRHICQYRGLHWHLNYEINLLRLFFCCVWNCFADFIALSFIYLFWIILMHRSRSASRGVSVSPASGRSVVT